MPYADKNARQKASERWRKNNKEHVNAQKRARRRGETPEYRRDPNTQQSKTLFIQAWKVEHGCRDCGDRRALVLDTHHIDPATKNPRLKGGKMGLQQLSWVDLEIELRKCVPLCANCHRLENARIGGWL